MPKKVKCLNIIFIVFLITLFIFGVFEYSFKPKPVESASSDNVSGWAWSETIGWISFNNTSGGGAINYGVNINPSTGDFSGYAWSENIGWISFNRADTGNPPAAPYNGGSGPIANFDFVSKKVRGWARALVNGGGWDGWIKLGDDSGKWQPGDPQNQAYVQTLVGLDELHGWAWGSDVVGWISFNCAEQGICGSLNYKVFVDINYPPTVTCNDSETLTNPCVDSRNPLLAWNYSDPDADPQASYQLQVDSDSGFLSPITIDTGIVDSSSKNYQPSGTTLQWNVLYYWHVKVKDSQGSWSGWSSNCSFTVLAHAYPSVNFTWLPQKPSALEPVQFTDQSTCYDDVITGSPCSSPNDSFKWTIPKTQYADPLVTFLENPVATFSEEGTWDVILEVTDSAPTSFKCSIFKSVKVSLPLPEWKEVIPR